MTIRSGQHVVVKGELEECFEENSMNEEVKKANHCILSLLAWLVSQP